MSEHKRELAKACGAAQRAYQPVVELARIARTLPGQIARQGNTVLEELDLLRFYLREATLHGVINPPPPGPDETVEERYQRHMKPRHALIDAARERGDIPAAALSLKPRSATRAAAKRKPKR